MTRERFRVSLNHAEATVTIAKNRVIAADAILSGYIGWFWADVRRSLLRRGATVERIPEYSPPALGE